jgi:hypothetical protein
VKSSKKSRIEKVENIRRWLSALIKSIPGVQEVKHNKFQKGKRQIWLSVRKSKVEVNPVNYEYTSTEEVKQEEFELKDAIETYLKYGFKDTRLFFKVKTENEKKILYCILKGAGIEIKFRPKWLELLNGVNRMVFTEFENAKKGNKDTMVDILKSLEKIRRRAAKHCHELGYDV